MRMLFCCLLALSLAGLTRADDKEGDALAKDFLAQANKIVEMLKGIKDKATAEKAKPDLEKAFAELMRKGEQLRKLPDGQGEALAKKYRPQLDQFRKGVEAEVTRLQKDKAIMTALAGVEPFKSLAASRERVARIQLMTLNQALQVYKVKKGDYPASLEDLTQGKAIVEPAALNDPWGKPYQYDPAGPKNKGKQPDLWTTDPSGKVIGNWEKPTPPPPPKDREPPKDKEDRKEK
jgi:hypothetical protein